MIYDIDHWKAAKGQIQNEMKWNEKQKCHTVGNKHSFWEQFYYDGIKTIGTDVIYLFLL